MKVPESTQVTLHKGMTDPQKKDASFILETGKTTAAY